MNPFQFSGQSESDLFKTNAQRQKMDVNLNIIRQLFLSELVSNRECLNKYKLLKTDEERFKFALETVVQHSAFLLSLECEQKNSEHSSKLRQNGNESFKNHRNYQALQEYTESILYAESSEELAVVYANRSAALFELTKFEDCVKDIDKALSLEYPDRLKTKLYKRKGLCLKALGRPGANSSFQTALIWLDKMTLSKPIMDRMKSELRALISDISCTVAKPLTSVEQHPLPGVILSPNSELPCASDAIALKYSKEYGRHLVATRKIQPGEILAIEKPYCMRLFTDNICTHCSYCLQVSWTMIPCERCVNVAYCSEACKSKAWEEYHEVECPVVGLLLGFDADEMPWMSLRMTIMAIQKGMKLDALREELLNIERNTDPRTKGYCSDGKLHSDKYRSVYSLTDDVAGCSPKKLLSGALRVALTMSILARETEIFGEKLRPDTLADNPNIVFVGGLMLKHLHIIFINAHSFGAARCIDSYEHGHSLMAVCSLVNHSCDPNTLRQWYSDCMALYAAYPIEQGEQIFDNYGPHYLIKVKSERQDGLKHWNFNCKCCPCTNNWPLLGGLPSYKKQRLTREKKQEIHLALQEFEHSHISLTEHNIKENIPNMLSAILKVIQILSTLVQRPCKELASAVATLEDLYATADGLFDYAPTNPSASEAQYLSSFLYFSNTCSEE